MPSCLATTSKSLIAMIFPQMRQAIPNGEYLEKENKHRQNSSWQCSHKTAKQNTDWRRVGSSQAQYWGTHQELVEIQGIVFTYFLKIIAISSKFPIYLIFHPIKWNMPFLNSFQSWNNIVQGSDDVTQACIIIKNGVDLFLKLNFYNPLFIWFQEVALFTSVKLFVEMNCLYLEGWKCFHYVLSIIQTNAF